MFLEVLSNIELINYHENDLNILSGSDFEKYIKQRSLFKFIKEIKVDNALDKNDRFDI